MENKEISISDLAIQVDATNDRLDKLTEKLEEYRNYGREAKNLGFWCSPLGGLTFVLVFSILNTVLLIVLLSFFPGKFDSKQSTTPASQQVVQEP